jgi:hypothetical protein
VEQAVLSDHAITRTGLELDPRCPAHLQRAGQSREELPKVLLAAELLRETLRA